MHMKLCKFERKGRSANEKQTQKQNLKRKQKEVGFVRTKVCSPDETRPTEGLTLSQGQFWG